MDEAVPNESNNDMSFENEELTDTEKAALRLFDTKNEKLIMANLRLVEMQAAITEALAFLVALKSTLVALQQYDAATTVRDIERLLRAVSRPPEERPVAAKWDWEEDFNHENGQYQSRCVTCTKLFIGHKRRAVCKVCASRGWVARMLAKMLRWP